MMENNNFEEQQKFERARKRVKALTGFYKHLTVYILINAVLLTINFIALDPGEKFLDFGTFAPAFFWGIGIVFHALAVFGPVWFFGYDWEQKKIQELMDREKQQKWE